jgi:hypothetical protein
VPGWRAGVSASSCGSPASAAPTLRAVPATCGACSHSRSPQEAARVENVDSFSESNSAPG